MSATCTAIADALVAALAGATFSMPIAASRTYQPEVELAAGDGGVVVQVVPAEVESARLTRDPVIQADHAIHIGIQAQLTNPDPATDSASVDALLVLAQEIEEFVQATQIGPSASYPLSTRRDPLWSPDHLKNLRQFTTVIVATYRVTKKL